MTLPPGERGSGTEALRHITGMVAAPLTSIAPNTRPRASVRRKPSAGLGWSPSAPPPRSGRSADAPLTSTTRKAAGWLACLLTPLLAGCPQDLSIAVAEGSTASDLRFAISNYAETAESGELSRFSVIELGGIHGPGTETMLWEISHESEGTSRVSEVVYGTPPPGFREVVAPTILVPGGRYYATGGSAHVEFRVSGDGTVTEFRPDEDGNPFSASGLQHEDVERFWSALRRGLEPPSPAVVADLVHYPLHVTTPDSTWHVADRDVLMRDFDALFPAELRDRVMASALEDLVSTSRGVAVALGRLWIGPVCEVTGQDPCPPAIFELNRFGEEAP